MCFLPGHCNILAGHIELDPAPGSKTFGFFSIKNCSLQIRDPNEDTSLRDDCK